MKKYERESFAKSFLLFFSTLLFLNSIIFLYYFKEQKHSLHVEIFNKIKIYNYNFKDKDMDISIVPLRKIDKLFTLNIKGNEIFTYFSIPDSKKNSLKIIYPYKKYMQDVNKIKNKTLEYYMLSTFILLVLSILYSLYAIRPLKKALFLLDEFLKDIIHDLNTPITSIQLNLKILKSKHSQEALKRIEFSTKKIGSLYGNLESIISNKPLKKEKINVSLLLNEKIEYYKYLYPDINIYTQVGTDFIDTSIDEFGRIIDNLISNACKYNKENGKVLVNINKNELIVEDTGIGIKNPQKVFQRYYKESERGIGLGLDIVKKLCKKLGYKIGIVSLPGVGTKIKVTFK